MAIDGSCQLKEKLQNGNQWIALAKRKNRGAAIGVLPQMVGARLEGHGLWLAQGLRIAPNGWRKA
jgi:hypothetical protein